MTEAEWLAAADPEPMITFLDAHFAELDGPDRDQDAAVWWGSRKLRLWGVACCRRIEYLIVDLRSRDALVAVERYCDGVLSRETVLNAARSAARVASQMASNRLAAEQYAASAVSSVLDDITGAFDGPFFATELVIRALLSSVRPECGDAPLSVTVATQANEQRAQAELVREVFGNPFRPVALEPAWLTSDVRALAHAIYAERAWDRMPILADALQEAGCDNEDVLAHCRSGTAPHVRGCWVVDLLLGKGGPTAA